MGYQDAQTATSCPQDMHLEPLVQAQSQQRPQTQHMQTMQVQQPHFLVGCMFPFSHTGQLPEPPWLITIGAGAGACIIIGWGAIIIGWAIMTGCCIMTGWGWAYIIFLLFFS